MGYNWKSGIFTSIQPDKNHGKKRVGVIEDYFFFAAAFLAGFFASGFFAAAFFAAAMWIPPPTGKGYKILQSIN